MFKLLFLLSNTYNCNYLFRELRHSNRLDRHLNLIHFNIDYLKKVQTFSLDVDDWTIFSSFFKNFIFLFI